MNPTYPSQMPTNPNDLISTIYICGNCGNEQEIRPRDNIICKECNGRIFYKKRSKKASQYEAR